ncbi:hypothetical protein BWI17_18840 [Betaproteobacteria bacterium GR16-43]|nr:hypothetical protein BWI17_18840 [Betaproteobacteria bacterium GR16-43]
MKKFGFKIQTRGGSTVDNLVIQGRDREEAQRKLRQVYHHCTILDEKLLADPVPEDASQLEGVISIITSESEATLDPAKPDGVKA